MIRIALILVIAAFILTGCAVNQAEELFDTAQFEELQNNYEHAEQLYEEILQKYPDSEYAKKARESLARLRQKK